MKILTGVTIELIRERVLEFQFFDSKLSSGCSAKMDGPSKHLENDEPSDSNDVSYINEVKRGGK